MGQVLVEIGGRSYALSCRDGDEAHLTELADGIAQKADALTVSLGTMTESRLLLMSALMVADELHDTRAAKAAGWIPPGAADTNAIDDRLSALLARAERLAVANGV